MTSNPTERFLRRSARFDRTHRVRAMSAGEITDTALMAFRVGAKDIIPMAALPTIFCAAGDTFWDRYLTSALFETTRPDRVDLQVVEFFGILMLALCVALPLFLFGLAIIMPVVVQNTAMWMLGESREAEKLRAHKIGFGPVFRLLANVILRSSVFLLVSILFLAASGALYAYGPQNSGAAGVVAVLGLIGVSIGMVAFFFVACRYCLALPAMIIERLSVKEASQRSISLMGKKGKIISGYSSVLTLAVTMLLLYVVFAAGLSFLLSTVGDLLQLEKVITGLPLGAILWEAYAQVPAYISMLFTVPIVATGITVVYFERRARQEGFDIAHLAHEIATRQHRRFDVTS